MAKAVGFTPDAGRRIAAAVRAVEGIDNTGRRLPRDIRGSGGKVAFEVVGNGAGGGKYQLTLLTGAATSELTGNATMPEGMTADADNAAIGVNMVEDGSAKHVLPAGMYGLGVITGRTSAGIPIVMFDMMPQVVIRGTATKTGGAAGSLASSTSCAFVYTIYGPFGGTALATGVSPERARYPNCAYTVPDGAQPAKIYQDLAGVWHLMEVMTERAVTAVARSLSNPSWNGTLMQFEFDQEDCLVLDKKAIEGKAVLAFYDCDGARPS